MVVISLVLHRLRAILRTILTLNASVDTLRKPEG